MGQKTLFSRRLRATTALFAGVALSTLALIAAPIAGASAATLPCGSPGVTALIAAINGANIGGGGSINLAPGCTYSLTEGYMGTEDGLPAVTSHINVNGNGATIAGNDTDFRIFEVDGPGGNLSLQNVTITGGNASGETGWGGGIINDGGVLRLDHSVVSGNSAGVAGAVFPDLDTGIGGGIASGTFFNGMPATTNVNNSQVDDNTTLGFGAGGGIANGDYITPAANSSLTVNDSQVDGNMAPQSGGGGIQNGLSNATLNHSQVNGNTSLNGGGIASGNTMGGAPPGVANLTINNSQVNGNRSTATLMKGSPPFGAGGIANGSFAQINNAEIDGNSANLVGGGILNHGTMTINNAQVNDNMALSTANVMGFPVGSGAGIVNLNTGDPNSGVLELNSCQVNSNSAAGDGGGILNGVPTSIGSLPPSILSLNHCQVDDNTAAHHGGIYNANGTVTLNNTSLSGNSP